MKLSLLVQAWRERYTRTVGCDVIGRDCADELEAALAAEQTEAFDLRHDYPEPENALAEITSNYIEATYNWEAPPGISEAIKFGYEAALRAVSQPTRDCDKIKHDD